MAHSGIRLTATGPTSGGTTLATFAVTAGMAIPISGGMRFPNGLHADLTLADDVTFWLGGR